MSEKEFQLYSRALEFLHKTALQKLGFTAELKISSVDSSSVSNAKETEESA